MARKQDLSDGRLLFDDSSKRLRWFLLSSEASQLLLYTQTVNTFPAVPFVPKFYKDTSLFDDEKHENQAKIEESCMNCLDVVDELDRNVEDNETVASEDTQWLEFCSDTQNYSNGVHEADFDSLQGNGTMAADSGIEPETISSMDSCSRLGAEPSETTCDPLTGICEAKLESKSDDWNRRIINYADPEKKMPEKGSKIRWHAPPPHIYKPVVQVSSRNFSLSTFLRNKFLFISNFAS